MLFFSINISYTNSYNEEEKCFEVLNEQMVKDPRFSWLWKILPKWNLEEVLLSETSWSFLNLSKYDNFKKYLAKNPSFTEEREKVWLNENDFLSRRNNIATIIASDNYIVSQVVWFWRNSNFDFPLQAKWKSFWDKYKLEWNNFKEFVLYTHHSIKWDLLSCWIFHLTPLNWRTYWNVAETWYFTNILQWNTEQTILWNKKCSSWFEWEYLSKDSMNFYSMKTNVCVIDYARKDFVKQEILTVAYDNKSNFFNEYIIFPLQVSAMKNTDLTSNWLAEVREKFLEYVSTKTCLSLVHKNIKNLPKWCKNKYSSELLSLNNNFILAIIDKIIPSADAAREFNFSDKDIESAKWIVVYESLPYELHEKLLKIPNKNFIEYIKLSLTPNFENFIKYRKENNILLSNYEDIFLSCNIDYKEREKIIIDFLTNLKEPEKFNIEDLSYSNKKFWDCIIPYPDKENRNIVIEWSFSSNKILAEKLNWTYIWDEVNSIVLEIIEEENKINIEYQRVIEIITNQYNEWIINNSEFEEKINIEKENLNKNINLLEEKYNYLYLNDNSLNKDNLNKDNLNDNNLIEKNKRNIVLYSIILVLVLIWSILIFKIKSNQIKSNKKINK